MAFEMGGWTKAHSHPFTVAPGGQGSNQPPTLAYHFELADQNVTTSPVMQFPTGVSWVRAIINQKGWVSGTGTVGPIYAIEVAFDSGFTSQVRELDPRTLLRDGLNQTVVLAAPVPDLQSLTFCRVLITKSGTDNVTVDYIIDAIPGI